MRKSFIKFSSAAGFSVVENLVAIAILGAVLAASSNMIILAMHSNASARSYAVMSADVQQIFDNYRGGNYATLLGKFGTTPYSSISDGQTATETTTSSRANATYTTTFTAIKSSGAVMPVAIKVRVTAVQSRGKLGQATKSFETVITQIS